MPFEIDSRLKNVVKVTKGCLRSAKEIYEKITNPV